ncbi:MAG: 1-acyl-sn-glycerol-3-phosphate acyltransferase, partial [Bacteroidota bacterium]
MGKNQDDGRVSGNAENGGATGFPPVFPDIQDWPILRINQKRDQLIRDVIAETVASYPVDDRLTARVADAYYHERIRMKENPWKVDRKDEPAFWRRIKSRLQVSAKGGQTNPEVAATLLEEIISRYTHEIAGDFKPGTYRFARRAINVGFTRLFSAASEGWFRGMLRSKRHLQEKMKLVGHLEEIRNLTKKGTVILVPTHFSNLDSIVIGWAIENLGLPAYTYGAGINLFGHPLLSHFMSRLGAFRVDRRKKNELYIRTLKLYTEFILREGAHMLFFPGGTRS